MVFQISSVVPETGGIKVVSDLFNIPIPLEVAFKIFSYLEEKTLAKISFVNRSWRTLANHPFTTKKFTYFSSGFGIDKWAIIFGTKAKKKDIGEDCSSISLQMLAVLNSPCPINEGKKVSETHIWVKIPTKVGDFPFTLRNLCLFAKKYFQRTTSDYADYVFEKNSIRDSFDTPIQNPYWVLMYKGNLPLSDCTNKSLPVFKNPGLEKHQIPLAIEAVACSLIYYAFKQTHLFGEEIDNTHFYTRQFYTLCQEKNSRGFYARVGSSSKELKLTHYPFEDEIFRLGCTAVLRI